MSSAKQPVLTVGPERRDKDSGVESSAGQLVVKPLTARRWPAFADLFDQGGPAGRCW
jgi:hypothetical protein